MLVNVDCLTAILTRELEQWWRHDMETPPVLLAICEGNPSVTDGFPSQMASNADFEVYLLLTSKSCVVTVMLLDCL